LILYGKKKLLETSDLGSLRVLFGAPKWAIIELQYYLTHANHLFLQKNKESPGNQSR